MARIYYITIVSTIFIFCSQIYPQQRKEISATDTTSSNDLNNIDASIFSLDLSYYYGFAIPHAKEVVNIRGTNPIGYELNFNWLMYTREVWDDCHCYPSIGFNDFILRF